MIAFCLRAAWKCLVLAGALYVVFFVKVGRFTTYEHLQKIGATNEAKEFESEVADAVGRAKSAALTKVGNPTPSSDRR